jgi:hypothetical protein
MAITALAIAAMLFTGLAIWQHRDVPLVSQFLGVGISSSTQGVPASGTTPPKGYENTYASTTLGISVRYPKEYGVVSDYAYADTGPGSHIRGVKFVVPDSLWRGTNLGNDSGISVEELPDLRTCSALPFLPMAGMQLSEYPFTDGGVNYLVASTSGAGAGNFYVETVYALKDSQPCTVVRYFIHSTNIDNYPPGAVVPYDRQKLLSQFDAIRHSLVLSR